MADNAIHEVSNNPNTAAALPETHARWMDDLRTQTQKSDVRDKGDIAVDNSWTGPDKQSADAATKATDLNNTLLEHLKKGESLSSLHGLTSEIVKAHQGLNKLNREDEKGDNDAIAKDKKDIQGEKKDIAAMAAVPNPTEEQRQALDANRESKNQLIGNESADAVNEKKYAAADRADNKANDALIKAIQTGDAHLPQLLIEANEKHSAIIANRHEDMLKEPGYVADDKKDMAKNADVAKVFGFKLENK